MKDIALLKPKEAEAQGGLSQEFEGTRAVMPNYRHCLLSTIPRSRLVVVHRGRNEAVCYVMKRMSFVRHKALLKQLTMLAPRKSQTTRHYSDQYGSAAMDVAGCRLSVN